jgi:hypothetical protein
MFLQFSVSHLVTSMRVSALPRCSQFLVYRFAGCVLTSIGT